MYHLLFIFRNLPACASFQLEAALTDLDPYSLSSSQIQMFPQGSPEVKFSSHTRIATTYSTTRQQKKKKLFHTHTCTDTMQTTGTHTLRRCWVIPACVRSAKLQSYSVCWNSGPLRLHIGPPPHSQWVGDQHFTMPVISDRDSCIWWLTFSGQSMCV